MNTLVKITIFLGLLLATLFTTSSCMFDSFTGVKGNRNVVSEERLINSNFDIINVRQGITLYLTQDESTKINVEADENIIDLLITEVKSNELNIYFEKNVYKAKARNVYLSTKAISKIKTSSGAFVKSENTVQTTKLELDSSSGSSIKIKLIANEVNSETSSGANIDVFGKTKIFSGKASSGSSINAGELKTVDAIVSASSGANIDIYASKKLTATASSGGDIDYEGSPINVNKDTSSGGSITGS